MHLLQQLQQMKNRRKYILQHLPETCIIILISLLLHTNSQNTQQPNNNASPCCSQSPAPESLQITLSYVQPQPESNISRTTNISVYGNYTLNASFQQPPYIFNCANLDLFILNITTYNMQYQLILQLFTQGLLVQIYPVYSNYPGPQQQNYTCSPPSCVLPINSNCNPDVYSTNIVQVLVFSSIDNSLLTQFQYNTICNFSNNQGMQIQWGVVIVVVFSIVMVFISSKFQNIQSYDNIAIYISYPIILVYFLTVIVKNILLTQQVQNFPQILNYVCIVCSFILGSLSTMVCFSQFAYATKIRFFRKGYKKGILKLRVMQFVGLVLGVGLVVMWYYIHQNWILSDIIFTIIYLTFNKIFKIGSLKIAFVLFICIMVIDGIFFRTTADINNPYTNLKYTMFNNPLFLIVPIIQHIPNRRCVWYFLLSMAYPGMFLSYLERFDRNRSSSVYGLSFILCYIVCSVVWLVLSAIFINVLPFMVLPYQLFTIPFVALLLVLFANRRGQIQELWSGQFYDQTRNFLITQKQIQQRIRTQSFRSYEKSMFSRLKYGSNTSDLNSKQSKGISNLSNVSQLKNLQMSEIKRSNTFDANNKNSKNVKRSESSEPHKQEQLQQTHKYYNSLYLSANIERISSIADVIKQQRNSIPENMDKDRLQDKKQQEQQQEKIMHQNIDMSSKQ